MASVPAASEKALATVPLYSVRDAARYLHLPRWLVWDMSGQFPFPFPAPWEETEFYSKAGSEFGPSLSFLQLSNLFVHAAALLTLAEPDEDEPVYVLLQRFRDLWERSYRAMEKPFLRDGETVEEGARRLAEALPTSARDTVPVWEKLLWRINRVEVKDGVPVRLFPITRSAAETSPRLVALDPTVRFGQPTLVATGLLTSVLYERFLAGDSLAELAEDYDTSDELIEEAIRYEGLPVLPTLVGDR